MPTTYTRLRHLLVLYTEGSLTPEEDLELKRYLANPQHRDAIEGVMAELWDTMPQSDGMDPDTTEAILQKIMTVRPISPWRAVYRYAAVFVCLVLAGWGTHYLLRQTDTNDRAIAQSATQHEAAPRAIVLPDGSTVLLKEGSKLEYPNSFAGASTRSVTLVGEGYFDIVHDPAKPFIVHTGALQTRVLGTAFLIKAYDNESNITVTVSRGKVQVTDNQRVLGTLTKDQQITFDKQRQVAAQQEVHADSTLAWTRQDIYFDDVTFSEATSRLSARFGVKVQFANERVSQCKFTATFIEGESFIKVLEVICAFNHANYHQTGPGEFIIEGPGC